MSISFERFINYISNGKNFYKVFFFLVIFLSIIHFPSLHTSDIQPWDEGMYTTRVLSIHLNGDFIDQSFHSVGKFYSSSHPPLLIWIGYFTTLVFGISAATFKILTFLFSLFCIYIIMLIGKSFFTIKTGLIAALIFSANVVFLAYSERFQFDIPYTLFILLSFYFLFKYNESLSFKYMILAGISFGLCLMTKILVGLYVPIVLFCSYYFIKDKINFKLKDIIMLTLFGIVLASPWHIYMLINHGTQFTDYFLGFHLVDRALYGVEKNWKSSGVLFYINYLVSIIPFTILLIFGFMKDIKSHKHLDWIKILLWVWFIAGFIILTLFKTKLEVYTLLIIPPACFLIPLITKQVDMENLKYKAIALFAIIANVLWFMTLYIRQDIKSFAGQTNKPLLIFAIVVLFLAIYMTTKYLIKKIEFRTLLFTMIIIFFLGMNFYDLLGNPLWKNKHDLSEIRDYVFNDTRKKIIYIVSNYRNNPQFSYYFKGLNLGWESSQFDFQMIDTNSGLEKTKKVLSSLEKNNYFFIVERDFVNNSVYPDSRLFIPEDSKLILKRNGYELYSN